MAKERALDIFQLLGDIDRKSYDLWDKLTEEQRKEFSPYMTMWWMAGTNNPVQLIFLNEIVNTSVFQHGEKKELLLKLLTVCSQGGSKRYQWKKYKVAGGKKHKKSVELVANHYNLSLKQAEESLKLFSVAEVVELAELAGLQKDEITEIKKELK